MNILLGSVVMLVHQLFATRRMGSISYPAMPRSATRPINTRNHASALSFFARVRAAAAFACSSLLGTTAAARAGGSEGSRLLSFFVRHIKNRNAEKIHKPAAMAIIREIVIPDAPGRDAPPIGLGSISCGF